MSQVEQETKNDVESSTPHAEEWHHDGHFKFFTYALSARFEDPCKEFQDAFVSQFGSVEDAALEDAVRKDTVKATRWTAWYNWAVTAFQTAYWYSRWLGIHLVVLSAVMIISRAPVWMELLFAFSVLVVAIATTQSTNVNARRGVLITCGLILPLVAFPIVQLDLWVAIEAVSLIIFVAFFIGQIAHWIVAHTWAFSSTLFVFVAFLAGLVAMWHYLKLEDMPEWVGLGFRVGLILGLLQASVFALLQFGLTVLDKVLTAWKVRKIPEAEFVQSALWVIGMLTGRPGPPAATVSWLSRWEYVYGPEWPATRSRVVYGIEYLAKVLEFHIQAALCREDPASALLIRKDLSSRAAELRIHKYSVLLGKPGAREALVSSLKDAVRKGAMRNWDALPPHQDPVDKESASRLRDRVLLTARRVAILAAPTTVVLIVWLTGKSELLPFAALWTAVSLAEFLTPGAGAHLAKTASQEGPGRPTR